MSKRQRTVQLWAEQCGNPNALDVSARWYSCVAAHVIIGDRPLRGVAEMLSSHFLLIDDDGEVVFDAEVSEVISVERRQEVAVGENMTLGGDTAPIVRTCIELVVRSRGLDASQNNANSNSATLNKANGGGGGSSSSANVRLEEDGISPPTSPRADGVGNSSSRDLKKISGGGGHSEGKLISEEDVLASDSAFDPHREEKSLNNSSSGQRNRHQHQHHNNTSAHNNDDDGGYGANASSSVVPITFVLEGPEGAHFAAGMELLWRRKFRMLSLRDQAMCRCSHIADFIYTVSMLPLDVDCVLLQEQFPPNWVPDMNAINGGNGNEPTSLAGFGPQSFVGGGMGSPTGRSSFVGGGVGSTSPFSSPTGVTVNRDKSAVLRIDQNYVLRVIPRPDQIYDSIAAGSNNSTANSNNNASSANASFISNSKSNLGASGSPSSATGSQMRMRPQEQLPPIQPWAFHLSDILLITHNDNQLRIVANDGRVLLLGSVDTRTVYGSAEQRPVTAGNDGVNSASAVGAGGAAVGGLASASSASNLALERRKAEALATKAATGIDIAAMTAGCRNVLDIFLFYASTACYQQLYLTARGFAKPSITGKSPTGNAFDSPDESDHTARLMPPVIPPAACFSSNDLYRVYHHYCQIDVNADGTLSPVEMFSAIGPVLVDNEGTLPQALLKTFDVCKKGSIQLAEYFYGSRVLLRGTVKDRLLYLFALFDTESKGSIVLNEFIAGMRLVTALTAHTRSANKMSSAGTISRLGGAAAQTAKNGTAIGPVHGFRNTPDSLEAFSKELFGLIDTNTSGDIDVEEFCRAMTLNPTVINALKRISSIDENGGGGGGGQSAAHSNAMMMNADGTTMPANNFTSSSNNGMPSVIYSATLENASNPNTIVTFGHPRWREMVQILAGIEHACRHPEANRVVDQRNSFGVKVPHDCSAWGNHSLAGEVALRTMRNQQVLQAQQRAAAAAASGGRNSQGSAAANAAYQQLLNNPPSAVIPTGGNETITFNDYCPAVFHTIRRSFGISNEEYLQSVGISQLRSGLLFGNISCLYEMISSGRSGSFFYSSHDNKYILKTIPMAESVILRKMLPNYYEHVIKYPNTLLTRFCGLHALIRNGRKLIFVVMQNIFLNKVPVNETYDLKGSTVGRSTPMALRAPGVALKDNDFGARKLYMRGHIKKELIKQIQNDSELLARHNLNDYSFLLGIHTSFDGPLDKRNSPPCPFPSHNKFQQFYGGIEGAALIDPSKEARGKEGAAMNDVNALQVTNEEDWGVVETDNGRRAGIIPLAVARHGGAGGGSGGDASPTASSSPERPLRFEIYYVGIIDMLTDYGMKKRGEHYSKSILYDSKQVSCIAPQEYLRRYIQYLDSIMVAID